jgi:hypothetical protein
MAPKRKNAAVVAVVGAITESEALPADLRSLLGTTLPAILETNKADRHAFQAEVVTQSQEALSIVGKSMETAHGEALAKQEAIIAPAERTKRDEAVKEAEAKQKEAQGVVEASDAAKKEADKSVSDAETAVKAAQKDESAAAKAVAKVTTKKATYEEAITNEFATLTLSAKKSEKDAAVKSITALAKESGVGGTLMQAFGLACKTEPEKRSEFEATALASVKEKLGEALAGVSKQLEEDTAASEQKKADTAAAKEKLTAAEAAQKDAVEKLSAAKEALKEAKKSLSAAFASRHCIWDEMKSVCDAQDEAAKAVANFKEVLMPAFEAAKEKVAPVVEEEPAEEPPEKKQKTDEEAATEPVAAMPEANVD